MFRLLNEFKQDADGAVTVDWVVLTGALVGLGVMVATTIGTGAMHKSTGLGAHLESIQPGNM